MFLKRVKDPTTDQFDDDEWIRSLTEAQEVTTDISEDSVTYDQQGRCPKKVRPIQKREFLRKYASRRLFALSGGEIAVLATSMRQVEVGTPGCAEALANFRQLLFDEWMTGSLRGPLARINVDEKNCFGMIEWKAASRFLPKHTEAATWKQRMDFVVGQGSCGTGQGSVESPAKSHPSCPLGVNMKECWNRESSGSSILRTRFSGSSFDHFPHHPRL